LKAQYGLDDSVSILLTLALPILSIFANILAVSLYRKVGSFIGVMALFFGGIAVLTGAVLGLLHTSIVVLTVACFAIISCMASGCNTTIVTIFPLYMKGKVNSGMISGVLNGFCYAGSTISSYGLGVVADAWGWNAVFYLLLGVSVLVVAVTLGYLLISKRNKNTESAV
jgi:sugar phosphate permease